MFQQSKFATIVQRNRAIPRLQSEAIAMRIHAQQATVSRTITISTDDIPRNNDDRFAFDQVLEFLGGDLNLLETLGKIYQEDYPILIEEIEGASNTSDVATVRSSTHKLRGLVSNFRDARLMETLSIVEKYASVGDLSETRTSIPFIKQRCAWLSNEIMGALDRAR